MSPVNWDGDEDYELSPESRYSSLRVKDEEKKGKKDELSVSLSDRCDDAGPVL